MKDWERMAKSLDKTQDILISGTHAGFSNANSITVRWDTWVQIIIDLQRAKTQCLEYGQLGGGPSTSDDSIKEGR